MLFFQQFLKGLTDIPEIRIVDTHFLRIQCTSFSLGSVCTHCAVCSALFLSHRSTIQMQLSMNNSR